MRKKEGKLKAPAREKCGERFPAESLIQSARLQKEGENSLVGEKWRIMNEENNRFPKSIILFSKFMFRQ